MMFKNHLETIGRNEPIQRKAKFWQSYIRALKGTDDMRAPEGTTRPRSIFRPILSDYPTFTSKLDSWPYGQSIYADPTQPYDRIHVPGYRYLPISRETYGYTPRNLYPDRYRPGYYTKAWEDHLRRMSNLDSLYPRRYAPDPLSYHLGYPRLMDAWKPTKYMDDWKPTKYMDDWKPTKYMDDWKPTKYMDDWKPTKYMDDWKPSRYMDDWKPSRYMDDWKSSKYMDDWKPSRYMDAWKPSRYMDTWKPKPLSPKEKEIAFNYAGQPIYTRGGYTKRPLVDLYNPPMRGSLAVRYPWWHQYPELRPFDSPYNWLHSPFYLRDSYLSPVKRTYLWTHHPMRPFAHYNLWL